MIVTLTPNPAIDRILRLRSPLVPGRLHRVERLRELPGGKGLNLARMVATLGGACVPAGFLAGWNGRKFRALLESDGRLPPGVFVEVEGETRECQILLDDAASHPTEVNEAGPEVSLPRWLELLDLLPQGRVVLSGSLPPATPPEVFAEVLTHLPDGAVIDTSGAYLRVALERGVALVKPNKHELADLTGVQDPGVDVAIGVYRRYRTPVLYTMGSGGAALIGERVHVATAPSLRSPNPVGSGDALLGAYLWALEEGKEPAEALSLGVAAGAENARCGGTGVTREGVMAMARQVKVERLR